MGSPGVTGIVEYEEASNDANGEKIVVTKHERNIDIDFGSKRSQESLSPTDQSAKEELMQQMAEELADWDAQQPPPEIGTHFSPLCVRALFSSVSTRLLHPHRPISIDSLFFQCMSCWPTHFHALHTLFTAFSSCAHCPHERHKRHILCPNMHMYFRSTFCRAKIT